MARSWRGLLAAAGAAALVISACGQGPTPPAAGTGAPATVAATAAPVAKRGLGGDLKILYWQAPTILVGHQATGTKDHDAGRLMLEPLASWDKAGNPLANGLASEIPTIANGGVSKDLTTVTWKLRTGVKWSDGSAFSADDVAHTFTYQSDKASATSTSSVTEGVTSVVAKDPNTVVITYAKPNPFFYQWGVGTNSIIVQKKQFAACVGAAAKNCPANLAPIGTGPYKLKEFKPGDVVLYEINENFRDPNKPFFKTVTLKGGGDATSAARAVFQTGDADYGWNLQVEASIIRPMAQGSDKGKLLTAYGPSVERLLLNRANPAASLGEERSEPTTKHPFFTDKAVRRALAMATNRKAIAQQIYGDGLVGKDTCPIITAPEAMVSKATPDVCTFDLTKAEAELQNAGWVKGADGVRAKGGVRLEAVYQTTVNPARQKTQDVLKADWEKIGFKITLKSVPANVFFTNTSPDGANKFFADIEMFTNSGDPDPTSYLSAWTCAEVNSKAGNWQKGGYERYCNPEFDAIITELRSEADTAKRNELVIKANDILISDVVIIPLINRIAPSPSGVSSALKGVDPSPWDSEMYNIADWSK